MAPEEGQGSEAVKFCMVCHQNFTGRMQSCPKDGTVLISTKPATQKDPFIGTILADKYEILSSCGKGGMGLVYKARQQLIDRIVAIKMLKADLADDKQNVARFQLEAKAASRLQHPNVITVHDFGVVEDTGQPYLVMDFMEGDSLADIIKKEGRINIRRAIPIFLQACSALEHAHRQHVIHRDVKPSNIVLIKSEDKDDFVKVVDFGIAKLQALAGQESMHLTKTGEVFGSPIYMSPEQCMGNALDARSDIYSLGATIYEALVGFPPLVGKTLVDTMHKHINETPASLRATFPELCVPEAIERVIMKALEKDKELRYESMLEMKEALEFGYKRFLDEQAGGAPELISTGQVASQTRAPAVNTRSDTREISTGKPQIDALRSHTSQTSAGGLNMLVIVAGILALLAGGGWFIWSQMSGGAASGNTVTGIVYFLQEDSYGGSAHICTTPGRNLLKLGFKSLDKKSLTGSLGGINGAANGASWTVTFHKGDNGLILDKASFDSSFDEPIQNADHLIRKHYKKLAEGDYKGAYEDLSEGWRAKESIEDFEKGNKRIKYSREGAEKAPTAAIKIVEQGENLVKLMVDLSHFTGGGEEYFCFTIKKLNDRWSIDSGDQISHAEWEGA